MTRCVGTTNNASGCTPFTLAQQTILAGICHSRREVVMKNTSSFQPFLKYQCIPQGIGALVEVWRPLGSAKCASPTDMENLLCRRVGLQRRWVKYVGG